MIVLHLWPLWSHDYFPSQDGPTHLESASIIRAYDDSERTVLRDYYVLNRRFTPNWAGHLVLAGLMAFMTPLLAEKVFLSGYVILLPLAVRYAVSAIQESSAFLVFLAFPFVYNYALHMGFYSFSYSLAGFFLVSGYWIKHRQRFGARETITLAILSLLLFFGHIVSTVAAALEIVLLATVLAVPEAARQLRGRRFSLQVLRATTSFRPVYALLPSFLLFALFLVQNGQGRDASWEDKPPFATLVKDLLSLYSLVSYDQWEVWVARGVAALFGGIVAYLLLSRQVTLRFTFWNGFLLIAVIYALIYLFGPSSVGNGSYIHERMNLYPFLALILWFAAQTYGPIARQAIIAVAIALAGAFVVIHSIKYTELNGYLAEYLSASPAIEPNTTLLPIIFSERGDAPGRQLLSSRIDFLLNAAGYITAERHVVDLWNYQASQTPFFPVLFRADLNPSSFLGYLPLDSAAGELRALPTQLLSFPRRTGGRIDYVHVWGVRSADRERQIPKLVLKQLEEGYDLVATSPQRGLLQLYRRKGFRIVPGGEVARGRADR